MATVTNSIHSTLTVLTGTVTLASAVNAYGPGEVHSWCQLPSGNQTQKDVDKANTVRVENLQIQIQREEREKREEREERERTERRRERREEREKRERREGREVEREEKEERV